MNNYIEVPYIEVKQPIGIFYICSIKWQELLEIAAADIRQIDEESKKDNNFDSYLGIQRKISPNRIKEISKYVRTIDATFPTSIILHIDSTIETIDEEGISKFPPDVIEKRLDEIQTTENIKIDKESHKLFIRKNDKVAQILDGQHRIEGLRASYNNPDLFTEELTDFDLNVTIFVDLDIDDQAQIFSVINKAQTKVNKSLVYDLFEYAKNRSPQKTSHDIVRLLNRKEGSPFYRRIKILGTADNKDLETIAQATFVELIMGYISQNPMEDRDALRRRSVFGKKTLSKLTDQNQIEKYIFRNLFIDDKDEIIFQNIYNYFEVVKNKWPYSWENNIEGNILNKSTGLIALMRFIRPIINKIGIYEDVIEIDKFKQLFDLIKLEDGSFNKDAYVPGSSGQGKLFRDLLSYID